KLVRNVTPVRTSTPTTMAGSSRNVSVRSLRVRSAMGLLSRDHRVRIQDNRFLGDEIRELLADVIERVELADVKRWAAGRVRELDDPEVSPPLLHGTAEAGLNGDA